MSTAKESTLQVKDFRGVNRFAKGTVTAPNEFFTIQNMHPISRGELQALSGVVDQSGGSIPGVSEFVSSRFYTDAYGASKLLAWYIPNVTNADLTPAVTSANFTGLAAGADTISMLVTYVGAGGLVGSTTVSLTNINAATMALGATSFTFTLPVSIPTTVMEIDVYIQHPEETSCYAWCGSFHRTSAGFPASASLRAPLCVYIATTTIAPKVYPTVARCHDGSAARTKKIFVGVAPAVAQVCNSADYRQPRIALVNSQSPAEVLAVDVPETGTSEVEICFPYPPAGTTGALQFDGVDLKAWVPFWGETPEDLMAQMSSSGIARSFQASTVQYDLVAASAGADSVTLNNALVETLQDGDLIQYRGAGVTGLTAGTNYYIRVISGFARGGQVILRFYTTYANYVSNTFVDITAVGAVSGSIYMAKVIFSVETPVQNSRNGVQMVDDVIQKYDGPIAPNPTDYTAIASRTDGCFRNMMVAVNVGGVTTDVGEWENGFSIVRSSSSIGNSDLAQSLGCYVFEGFPSSASNRYNILPNINERGYVHSILVQLNASPTRMLAPGYFMLPQIRAMDFDEDDNSVSTTQFFQRMVMANGDNQLMYTNGRCWKFIYPSDGTAPVPSGKYVQAFADRIVNGGGRETIVSSPNDFYFTEISTLFNWGATINSINVFSREPINGFGAFSQNLIDQGFTSFLVISKRDSLFVWNGADDSGARQIYYEFGFAGPRSFVVADNGPIFVARNNVYTFQGDRIVPMGDEFQPLLDTLTDIQLQRISTVYHENKVKICYPSGSGSDPACDREIWIETRIEGGALQKFWSGPHVLKESVDQTRTITFNGSRDVRASIYGNEIYQRDSGKLNDGANIARSIVISRLGLEKDHFWKLLTRVYSAVQVAQNETFTLALTAEDGSTPYSANFTVDFSVAANQLAQWFVLGRFRGRVNTLTISNTSGEPISIFDISLLFQVMRRRTLRSGL